MTSPDGKTEMMVLLRVTGTALVAAALGTAVTAVVGNHPLGGGVSALLGVGAGMWVMVHALDGVEER